MCVRVFIDHSGPNRKKKRIADGNEKEQSKCVCAYLETFCARVCLCMPRNLFCLSFHSLMILFYHRSPGYGGSGGPGKSSCFVVLMPYLKPLIVFPLSCSPTPTGGSSFTYQYSYQVAYSDNEGRTCYRTEYGSKTNPGGSSG